MGILDDAIREHLELKRSHGAPEEELRRQEVEALGIAHDEAIREDEDVDATRAAGGGQDPELEDAPLPEPVPEPEEGASLGFDPGELAAEEPVFEPGAEVEPIEVAAEPREEVEPPPRRHSDTPTQGFDALSEDDDPFADEPPEPGPGDADLLEDTPDFLEETPEHDRLWFEQRPPRDFDFD